MWAFFSWTANNKSVRQKNIRQWKLKIAASQAKVHETITDTITWDHQRWKQMAKRKFVDWSQVTGKENEKSEWKWNFGRVSRLVFPYLHALHYLRPKITEASRFSVWQKRVRSDNRRRNISTRNIFTYCIKSSSRKKFASQHTLCTKEAY